MQLDYTYSCRVFVFVGVGCHVPDDLVCKKLGEFGGLNYISLYIPKPIVPQCLNDLWYIEECNVDRMTF